MRNVLWLLYQPYKWIIFLPILGLSTLILGTLAILLPFIINPKTAGFLCAVPWARINAYFTPMFIKVLGRENIDKKTSYIVVSNHQSQYDIFVIYGWLLQDIKWVMHPNKDPGEAEEEGGQQKEIPHPAMPQPYSAGEGKGGGC